MTLTAKQSAVATGRWARTTILEGAVRSGKTHVLNYITPYLALHGPKGKGALIAKTLETLRENILEPMQAILGRSMNYGDNGRRIVIEGVRIRGVGANDEKSQAKIRGDTLGWAVGDEVALWPESFFRMLLSRLSIPGAMFFGSTNPEGPRHWLKTNYIDRAGDIDLLSVKFRLEDNVRNLDPGYIKALKAELTGVWYQRYILGEWALAEGLVYHMIDEARHFVDLPGRDAWKQVFYGVDFGAANPTVFLEIGQSGQRFGALREYYYSEGRKTAAQLGDDFERFATPGATVYIDPSARIFALELRRRGFRVISAVNDVVPGIQVVSSALSLGNIQIDRSCKATWGEANSYSWDSRAQERGEDAPVKKDDHAMDALRYGVHTRIGRPGLGSAGQVG